MPCTTLLPDSIRSMSIREVTLALGGGGGKERVCNCVRACVCVCVRACVCVCVCVRAHCALVLLAVELSLRELGGVANTGKGRGKSK